MTLNRYWIRFQPGSSRSAPRPGCGVTAYSYEDALEILRTTIFSGDEMPVIEQVIEGVDISQLDQKHVIPNMDAPIWRGIWYPKGYARNY